MSKIIPYYLLVLLLIAHGLNPLQAKINKKKFNKAKFEAVVRSPQSFLKKRIYFNFIFTGQAHNVHWHIKKSMPHKKYYHLQFEGHWRGKNKLTLFIPMSKKRLLSRLTKIPNNTLIRIYGQMNKARDGEFFNFLVVDFEAGENLIEIDPDELTKVIDSQDSPLDHQGFLGQREKLDGKLIKVRLLFDRIHAFGSESRAYGASDSTHIRLAFGHFHNDSAFTLPRSEENESLVKKLKHRTAYTFVGKLLKYRRWNRNFYFIHIVEFLGKEFAKSKDRKGRKLSKVERFNKLFNQLYKNKPDFVDSIHIDYVQIFKQKYGSLHKFYNRNTLGKVVLTSETVKFFEEDDKTHLILRNHFKDGSTHIFAHTLKRDEENDKWLIVE